MVSYRYSEESCEAVPNWGRIQGEERWWCVVGSHVTIENWDRIQGMIVRSRNSCETAEN